MTWYFQILWTMIETYESSSNMQLPYTSDLLCKDGLYFQQCSRFSTYDKEDIFPLHYFQILIVYKLISSYLISKVIWNFQSFGHTSHCQYSQVCDSRHRMMVAVNVGTAMPIINETNMVSQCMKHKTWQELPCQEQEESSQHFYMMK